MCERAVRQSEQPSASAGNHATFSSFPAVPCVMSPLCTCLCVGGSVHMCVCVCLSNQTCLLQSALIQYIPSCGMDSLLLRKVDYSVKTSRHVIAGMLSLFAVKKRKKHTVGLSSCLQSTKSNTHTQFHVI